MSGMLHQTPRGGRFRGLDGAMLIWLIFPAVTGSRQTNSGGLSVHGLSVVDSEQTLSCTDIQRRFPPGRESRRRGTTQDQGPVRLMDGRPQQERTWSRAVLTSGT